MSTLMYIFESTSRKLSLKFVNDFIASRTVKIHIHFSWKNRIRLKREILIWSRQFNKVDGEERRAALTLVGLERCSFCSWIVKQFQDVYDFLFIESLYTLSIIILGQEKEREREKRGAKPSFITHFRLASRHLQICTFRNKGCCIQGTSKDDSVEDLPF